MKTLLIIGDKGSGKSTAANVARQIAEQHHGLAVQIIEEAEPAHYQRLQKHTELLIRVRTSGEPSIKGLPRADFVINLNKTRALRSAKTTFFIREVIDHLITPKPQAA